MVESCETLTWDYNGRLTWDSSYNLMVISKSNIMTSFLSLDCKRRFSLTLTYMIDLNLNEIYLLSLPLGLTIEIFL